MSLHAFSAASGHHVKHSVETEDWLILQDYSSLTQQPPLPTSSQLSLNIAGGEVSYIHIPALLARSAFILSC